MSISQLGEEKLKVVTALAEIARLGPVPSTGNGDMAVGKTLLDLLGINQTTTSKPSFHGMAISARRNSGGTAGNRVNLFAMVPDWKLSACKSSKEIADKYGYDRNGDRKLYASVRSRRPNAQGLFLEVDHASKLLREKHLSGNGDFADEVAVWKLDLLQARLLQRHPASAWVTANATKQDGQEYFHYRYIRFTDQPRANRFADLLDQGTVTIDHLILSRDGRTVEKGPLFKMLPDNMPALFPGTSQFDLMKM